jgi:hypothetical protein
MKSGTIWWATLTTWALSLFLRLGMALTSMSNYPDRRSPTHTRIDFSLSTRNPNFNKKVEESSHSEHDGRNFQAQHEKPHPAKLPSH